MVEEPSDFGLKFLYFSSSGGAGEQALSNVRKEAEILDAYSQAVTHVVSVVPAVIHIRMYLSLSMPYLFLIEVEVWVMHL